MAESDLEYLQRRAGEEAQLANEAGDPAIATIHRRMATLYADRVATLSDNPDFDPIVQLRLRPQSPTSSR